MHELTQETANPYASPMAATLMRQPGVMAEYPEAFRKVKLGLSLVYYGICGILLCALLMPILSILFAQGGGGGVAGLAIGMMVALGAIVLLSIMMLVGEIFCTAVPAASGAKRLALAAVVLHVIQVPGGIALSIYSRMGNPAIAQVLNGLLSLCGLAALICFVLFLRRVAMYIGRPDVAGRATRTLIVGGLSMLIILGGFATMVVRLEAGGDPGLMGIPMAIGGLTMLAAFLMYANTITYLRKAIEV